jgi:hypothetical protein
MNDTTDLMSIMKWKELAEVEEYLDCPMDEWVGLKSKAKLSFAMQYMMAKRNKPELTILDAEALTIQELTDLSGMDVQVPKEVTSA